MRTNALLMLILLTGQILSGCFGGEEPEEKVEEFNPLKDLLTNTTWYHYAGGLDANNKSIGFDNLTGNNTPYAAIGTYFGIGDTTFEPTIGVTSTGGIHFSSYGGTGSGTMVYTSLDQGQTWTNMGPFNPILPDIGQVPSSNDPYIYVDKWTDRIYKFDMHALTAMFVEYSDDDGQSWSIPFSADGYYSPQDHQSIASMPDVNGNGFYDTITVFCINTGSSALGPQCSRSLDGGHTWDVQRPGYPTGTPQCSGLHGHVAGSNDGAIYRGNPSCDGPAIYRSIDGGYTWTEHTITTNVPMQDGWHSHEVAVGADEAGNVFASWISMDQMPWMAYSRDQGDTWSEPMMVAPPGVNETGFPTIFAGDEGRVVVGYIGEMDDDGGWSGYMSVMTDAFAENPLITTVAVNLPNDPLDITDDCGNVRCGGFGDFIDVEIDDEGRPWIALAHNVLGEHGIVGTWITGPSLYGNITQLPVIAAGGPSTIN
jgi:hypothetical protein